MIYLLDLVEYSVKAWLLLFLCEDSIILKEKYRSAGRILFFLQTVLTSYLMSSSAWIDRLVYGNTSGMIMDSSHSIVKLVIIFGCSFVMMEILYQGRRMARIYLLLVFYTIQEMSKFIMHSAWMLAITGCINYLNRRLIAETIDLEVFTEIMEYLQAYGMWFFAAGYLTLMYIAVRMYRRYLTGPADEINRQGLWFLMLAPVIGMAFDVSWRISLYRQQGTEIESLYEKHGSMYVVIPVIAVLCLICTVFSRKIYSELMHAEEQKNSLLFYKQQLTDMTEHVKELEQLYDGIRGMRHDINNSVADMEQLLYMSTEKGQLPDRIRREAEGYLQNMQQAAGRLSLQFNTGNPVTDVILNRKGQICAQEMILLEGDLVFPVHLGIEAFDLGILLNNALDNAIEACRKIPRDKGRSIRFRGYTKGRMYFVVIGNSCDRNMLHWEGEDLKTTKTDKDSHGFGMNNMRSCVEKYYGTIQYEMKETHFVLTIMMQGRSQKSV